MSYQIETQLYQAVKLIDLHPDLILEFDVFVYQPVDNRYVRYLEAGAPVQEYQVAKMAKNKWPLFVASVEMPKFYVYTAKTLREMTSHSSLQTAVRDLLSSLFTDAATGVDEGRKIISDLSEIVKSYMGETPATRVSIFATLFAIGLGVRPDVVNKIARWKRDSSEPNSSVETQIVYLANEFCSLTVDKPRLTMNEGIQKIALRSKELVEIFIEPGLMKRFLSLFPPVWMAPDSTLSERKNVGT